jgi:hypothetical protein
MTHFKLLAQIDRDLKNQVLFDSLKRPTRRTRLMIHLRDHDRAYMATVVFVLVWAFALGASVRIGHAEEPNAVVNGPLVQVLPKVQCPTPGEKCKVLFLNDQEEQMLMTKNGILDTAAQARSLDLGQFAVYLKTRIAAAPAGEVRKDESKPADKEDKK